MIARAALAALILSATTSAADFTRCTNGFSAATQALPELQMLLTPVTDAHVGWCRLTAARDDWPRFRLDWRRDPQPGQDALHLRIPDLPIPGEARPWSARATLAPRGGDTHLTATLDATGRDRLTVTATLTPFDLAEIATNLPASRATDIAATLTTANGLAARLLPADLPDGLPSDTRAALATASAPGAHGRLDFAIAPLPLTQLLDWLLTGTPPPPLEISATWTPHR